MRNRVIIATIGLLLLVGCAVIFAQQTPTTAQETKKKDRDTVESTAKFMRKAWGAKKMSFLKGDVRFTHDDTVLTSDEVVYDEEAKIATSPGKVNITNPECDITGDKGIAYFNKKLGVVEGSVVMILKPKPETSDGEKTKDDGKAESIRAKLRQPTTITCATLEYRYKAKIATALGGVIFKQEKRTASAEKAVYDQKKELLTLIGNVRGVDEDGQTFCAPGTVLISLKKGDEWMEAKDAAASFKVDIEEEKGKE